MPELTALLNDRDAAVRVGAANAIGCVACEGEAGRRAAEAAKPALLSAMRDPDSAVRGAAIDSLGTVRNLSQAEVLAMAACLTDPEKRVRHTAAGAIGYLGVLGLEAKAAAPALEAALGDPDPDVRLGAASALGHIGSKRETSVPGLARMLGQGRRGSARFVPALVLGQMGPVGKSAAPALRSVLGNADAGVRAPAAWALWRTTADLGATVPVLVECLDSRRNVSVAVGQPPAGTEPDDDARHLAAAALLEIARSGASSRKVVDAALKKAPAEALTEFTKAVRTLIDEVDNPADGRAPKK